MHWLFAMDWGDMWRTIKSRGRGRNAHVAEDAAVRVGQIDQIRLCPAQMFFV